jgi:hypothetical protein
MLRDLIAFGLDHSVIYQVNFFSFTLPRIIDLWCSSLQRTQIEVNSRASIHVITNK